MNKEGVAAVFSFGKKVNNGRSEKVCIDRH